jgi:hypothetical protein
MTVASIKQALKDFQDIERVQALLKKALSKAVPASQVFFWDALFVGGIASGVYGVWLMHKPCAFIAGGIIISLIAVIMRR